MPEFLRAVDSWLDRWIAVPNHLADVRNKLTQLEIRMADVSADLNAIAAGINDLNVPVAAVIAERDALAAELAVLRGEEVAESEAVANLRTAFDGLRSNFASPELPDVDPLPEPEPPVEPVP